MPCTSAARAAAGRASGRRHDGIVRYCALGDRAIARTLGAGVTSRRPAADPRDGSGRTAVDQRGARHRAGGARRPGSRWARAVARLAARPGRLLVVADFDGTLAEASRDPGAARIVPLAQRALRRLAGVAAAARAGERRRPDGEDSGRRRGAGGRRRDRLSRRPRAPARDVRTRRPRRRRDAAEAGFEALPHEPPSAGGPCAAAPRQPAWLFVERKGPSVAFHVRQADDIPAARASVEAAIEAVEARGRPRRHDLAHYRGRLVVDLRPRAAGGKREAMERLIAATRARDGRGVRRRFERRGRVRVR